MSREVSRPPRNGFTFKQFFVAHDRCAMKVGTDGPCFGAWAPIAQVKHVLDIGSGSGLLALMLAQRTDDRVMLDAVELDEEAAAQARENVATSRGARSVHLGIFNGGNLRKTRRYELIVSNPPFFCRRCPCATSQREQARYTTTLDHVTLLTCAAELITEEGFSAWCYRWILAIRLFNVPKPWAGICVYAPMSRRRKCARRTAYCWLLADRGECFSDRLIVRGPEQQYSEGFTALTRDFTSLCEPEVTELTGRYPQVVPGNPYSAARGSLYVAWRSCTISSATCTRLRNSSKLFDTRKRA